MSRPGVTYETVQHTAIKLLSQGAAPSVQKIREVLGTGSHSTIANHLKVWREEYAKRTIHYLPATLPKELISSFEVLWQTAMEHAQHQLVAQKQSLDSEHEVMLQAEQASEKNRIELKQKLAEISTQLENEMAEKHRLSTELAVSQDRLEKKEEALTAQKEYYEGCLKRVYEEKEKAITHNQQLQNDLNLLQEKLAAQAEQQQKLLAQHSAHQEQSEKRWLNLIDQANQATKETRKKLEALQHDKETQLKKLHDQLTEMQFDRHKTEAQLKVALAQIERLEKAAQFLEADNVKAQATVMKLKQDLDSKNRVTPHPKKASKKDHAIK